MILSETIFYREMPVGIIRLDSASGAVDFSPTEGKSPLPDRHWSSIEELKAAVTAAYSNLEKDESPSDETGALKSLPRTTNHTTREALISET